MFALTLPGRAEAEHAIENLMRRDRLGFVLAVVGVNIPRINEQHGYDAGDRALESLALRLTGPPGGSRDLFRWSASAFVIVSRSLRKITPHAQMDCAVTAVFGAWPGDSPAALFDRMDNYIASRIACCEAA